MTQEERIREIKKLLEQKHHLVTKDLTDYFNVSFDTARRDVLRLTSTGQAIRVHGGLLANRHEMYLILLPGITLIPLLKRKWHRRRSALFIQINTIFLVLQLR